MTFTIKFLNKINFSLRLRNRSKVGLIFLPLLIVVEEEWK